MNNVITQYTKKKELWTKPTDCGIGNGIQRRRYGISFSTDFQQTRGYTQLYIVTTISGYAMCNNKIRLKYREGAAWQ